MARYYFDIVENGRELVDDYGDELSSDDEAKRHVRQLLAEQAKSLLRNKGAGEIIVKVRDASGSRFHAKLSVSLE
jgi:ribosomal protein S17E